MVRMARRLVIAAFLVALVVPAASCARRVTDFTVISTKNTMLVASAEKRERRITGEDCTFTLFGMPNMKTAIDDAIEKAGPGYDALVDGVVWYDDRFLYVCYRVEGTPLRAKDAPPEAEGGSDAGGGTYEGDRGRRRSDAGDRIETERGHSMTLKPRPAPTAAPAPTPALQPVAPAPAAGEAEAPLATTSPDEDEEAPTAFDPSPPNPAPTVEPTPSETFGEEDAGDSPYVR